jgi:DNA-binding PadR family transcriptional regulator
MIPDLAKLDPNLALLAELSRREGFGGDLARELGLGFGTAYPALRELEREGLVNSRPEFELGKRGRPRIYYSLTDAGRIELRALRARFRAWLGEDSDA